jgi:hypothetical protein
MNDGKHCGKDKLFLKSNDQKALEENMISSNMQANTQHSEVLPSRSTCLFEELAIHFHPCQ